MFVQTVLILHLMGMFFCVSRLKDLSGQMVFFNPVCLCPLPPILHPFLHLFILPFTSRFSFSASSTHWRRPPAVSLVFLAAAENLAPGPPPAVTQSSH